MDALVEVQPGLSQKRGLEVVHASLLDLSSEELAARSVDSWCWEDLSAPEEMVSTLPRGPEAPDASRGCRSARKITPRPAAVW